MAKAKYKKEPLGQNYNLSFTGREVAALNMALRNYCSRLAIKKTKSFEEDLALELRDFFEKNHFPSY